MSGIFLRNSYIVTSKLGTVASGFRLGFTCRDTSGGIIAQHNKSIRKFATEVRRNFATLPKQHLSLKNSHLPLFCVRLYSYAVSSSHCRVMSSISSALPSQDNGGVSTASSVPTNNSKIIKEGSATMAYPPTDEVFYNPVQVQNRDLSILMIALHAERRSRRRATILAKKAERKRLLEEAGLTEAESRKKGVSQKAFAVDMDAISKQMDSVDWTEKVKDDAKAGRPPVGNRDINVNHGGIRILDALAASGLRSIRYAKEIPGVDSVVVNDLDEAAIELAHCNIASNGCSSEEGNIPHITAHVGDAIHHMYSCMSPSKQNFDVIDIDPYGTAAPFLDAAVRTVANGGMLCVTCTDMAAMSGGHPETCYGRLGSMPVPKGKYCQELAIRLTLAAMATIAGRCGRTIRPVLSVGMAFYIRCFVEIWDDKATVNQHCLKIGNLYQSTQCPTFATAPHATQKGNVYQPSRIPLTTCPETGSEIKVAGPLWLDPIHDQQVVLEAISRLTNDKDEVINTGIASNLATRTNIHGLLTCVSEEVHDVPLYYQLPDLTKTIGCTAPPRFKIENAIINAGYRISAQHKEPQAVKTDAPSSLLWDILRCWVKEHPVSEKKLKNNEKAAKILGKEMTHDVNFSRPKNSLKSTKTVGAGSKKKAVRYPSNPEANWGPKPMAKGKKRPVEEIE